MEPEIPNEINEEIQKLQKKLEGLKKEKREHEQKYTFNGFYRRIKGRGNPLQEIKENNSLGETEKLEQGIAWLQTVLSDYQE